MPQLTDADKRLARVRRLVDELSAKSALNTFQSRARCRTIALELVELLTAEEPLSEAGDDGVGDADATKRALTEIDVTPPPCARGMTRPAA